MDLLANLTCINLPAHTTQNEICVLKGGREKEPIFVPHQALGGGPGVTYLLFPVIILTILQVTQFRDEKTRVK